MELKRIYLDTCVWCRPFDEPSHRVTEEAEAFFRILRMVNAEEVVITSSVVLDDEIDMIRGDEKREDVNELVNRAVSERIGYITERYRAIMNILKLKVRDAAHLACALESNAEYFITADDNILRKGKDIMQRYKIKVCAPTEFVESDEREDEF